MFAYGLIVGLFVGVPLGVLLVALCNAAANGDRHLEEGVMLDYDNTVYYPPLGTRLPKPPEPFMKDNGWDSDDPRLHDMLLRSESEDK